MSDTNHFSIQTSLIQKDVLAIGSLFTKAKLEFLEHPTLNCSPRIVAVGKAISCHGSGFPPNALTKATFQDANSGNNQTAQIVSGTPGSFTSNSFFDVFFDIAAPTTAGSYHLILEEAGEPSLNSFFDVFVQVTVTATAILEPTTIIPLTVLIAAIATPAVTSKRVRRPL